MGKKSRTKGRSFEQLVADVYRTQWPAAVVRRSLQAHRAYEPDVVVEDHRLGQRLWTECQHADASTPLQKLAQAERDILALNRPTGPRLLPIVVWRSTGSRTVSLTTRLWVLEELGGHADVHMEEWGQLVVTVDFHKWLKALG